MEEVGQHSEDEGGQRVRGNSDHSKRYKSRAVKCQVPGCKHELAQRAYYKRYRICNYHCNLSSLELKEGTVRWCQQCGRFQLLSDFAGDRKTCRAKLNKHNTRRRTARSRARGADDLPEGRGGSGGQHPVSSSTHSESAHPANDASPVQTARLQQHPGDPLAQLGSVFKQQGPSVSVVVAGQPLLASPRLAPQPRGGPLQGLGWARGGAEGAGRWQGLGLSRRELPWQEQLQPSLAQGPAGAQRQQQEGDWRGPATALAVAAAGGGGGGGQGPRAPSPSPDVLPPLGQQQWAQLMGTVLPPDFPPLQAAAALLPPPHAQAAAPPPPHPQAAAPPLPGPALDVLRSLNLSELASQIARPSNTSQDLPVAPSRPTPSHAPGIWSLPSLGLFSDLASCSLDQLCSLGESQLCSELLEMLQQLPGGAELTSALVAAQPVQEGGSAAGGSSAAGGGSSLPSLSSLPQWMGSTSMGLLAERGSGGSIGGGGHSRDDSRGSGNVAAGTLEAAGSGGGDSRAPLAAGPSGSAPALLLEALCSRAGAGAVPELPSLKQSSGSGGLLPIHPLAVHVRPPSASLPGMDPGASSEAMVSRLAPAAPAAPNVAAVAISVQPQPLRPVARPAVNGGSCVRGWQDLQGRELAPSPWSALKPRGQPGQPQEDVQQRWQQVWEAQRQVDEAGAGAMASTSGGAGEAAAAAPANAAAFMAGGIASSSSPAQRQEGNQGLASSPPTAAPLGEDRRDSELHHPPSPAKEAEGHAGPKLNSSGLNKYQEEMDDFLARAALTLFNVPPDQLAPSIREAIANLAAVAEAGAGAGAGQAYRGSMAEPSDTASDA